MIGGEGREGHRRSGDRSECGERANVSAGCVDAFIFEPVIKYACLCVCMWACMYVSYRSDGGHREKQRRPQVRTRLVAEVVRKGKPRAGMHEQVCES